jgi:MFS family permease
MKGQRRQDTPARRRLGDTLSVATVAGVALGVAAAGLGNEFAQDDLALIANNPRVHGLATWRELLTSPYWPPPHSEDLYRPLMSLLLALQYAAGAGSPAIFRVVSAVLYAAASLAVLLLARRLAPASVALGVGLLFAVHPVHVEPVALAVGQNELLVTLLAALMVTRYLDFRSRDDGTVTTTQWTELGVYYVLALLSKEHALVLPALLVAAEAILLAPRSPRRWRGLAPGFVALAAIAGGFVALRTAVLSGRLAGSFTAEALEGLSLGGRALTMLTVVPEWVRLLTWPAHLQADYSPAEITASTRFGPTEAVGLVLVVAMILVAWQTRRRAPLITFGLAWSALALAPVSNVVIPTGIVLAERTLFLASAGWLLAAGGVAAMLWPREPATQYRAGLAATCLLLTVAGAVRSVRRFAAWRDETTYALQLGLDAPRSYRAQLARASVLFRHQQYDAAFDAYDAAFAAAPPRYRWRVRHDLVRRLWDVEQYQIAVEQMVASVRESPDLEEARHYLVLSYLGAGDYAAAVAESDSALARGFNPDLFLGLRALADTALRSGAPAGAIKVQVRPPPGAGVPR